LNTIFQKNKGENQVTFEVEETETIKKHIEISRAIQPQIDEIETSSESTLFNDAISDETAVFADAFSEDEEPFLTETSITEMEETKTITRLAMPSRKLKIKISNELLTELEKMDVNFKLN
jgi:DNA polymerase-3 subunit alpha